MARTALWQMQDGKKVRVCDMTDKHLLNTIRYIERNVDRIRWDAVHQGYLCLSGMQGEEAINSIEDAIASLESDEAEIGEFCPIYDDMVAEAERRKLELLEDPDEYGPVITPKELAHCRRGSAQDNMNDYWK
jgi:hypothetical protein